MTRLLLFPIWLPYWFWERRKKKSEMREFVFAGTRAMNQESDDIGAEIWSASLLADDEFMHKLALEWVRLHPGDFVLGECDPKVAKLQSTFEKILSE